MAKMFVNEHYIDISKNVNQLSRSSCALSDMNNPLLREKCRAVDAFGRAAWTICYNVGLNSILLSFTGAQMLMSWIRAMLGPFNAVLDYFSGHPETLTALLAIWAGAYYTGYLQLKRIEAKTRTLVLKESRLLLQDQPGASAQELFEAIYPLWAAEFKSWKYLYIPHRWDLWPVRPTEKNVTAKLALNPGWVANLLAMNGIALGLASAGPQ